MHNLSELPGRLGTPTADKRRTRQTQTNKPTAAKTEVGTSLKNHTMEDVEIALNVLAYNGSNARRTSLQLETEYSIQVHEATLRKWAEVSFAQRYLAVQEDLSEELGKKSAALATDLALKAGEMQARTLVKIEDQIETEEVPVKDLAVVARNLAQTSDLNTRNAQLLRDKPTSINKNLTPDELLDALEGIGLIDGDADEIEDAEEVD